MASNASHGKDKGGYGEVNPRSIKTYENRGGVGGGMLGVSRPRPGGGGLSIFALVIGGLHIHFHIDTHGLTTSYLNPTQPICCRHAALSGGRQAVSLGRTSLVLTLTD